jgi:hypothetical protein
MQYVKRLCTQRLVCMRWRCEKGGGGGGFVQCVWMSTLHVEPHFVFQLISDFVLRGVALETPRLIRGRRQKLATTVALSCLQPAASPHSIFCHNLLVLERLSGVRSVVWFAASENTEFRFSVPKSPLS